MTRLPKLHRDPTGDWYRLRDGSVIVASMVYARKWSIAKGAGPMHTDAQGRIVYFDSPEAALAALEAMPTVRRDPGRQGTLTDSQVSELLLAAASGTSSKALARRYSISDSHVDGILRGQSYRHVAGPRRPARRYVRLTPDDVRQVREFGRAGMTQAAIAKLYGVAVLTIAKVLKGRTHREGPA